MLRTTVERADSGVASPRAMELLRKRYQKRFASFDESETSEIDPNEIIPSEAVLRKPETTLEILQHRIADILLITHLAFKLYGYLYKGGSWLFQFFRLVMFAGFLMPGFSQMIAFYYFSPRVIRSVPYGTNPRNVLDIYLPRSRWRKKGPCPVVIYVTGGAWIIGYKAWGALFARRLSQRGILVVCLDYRNFPQGTVTDMVEDCNHGISWAMNNCHLYGGDQKAMYLVGQSAGVHLSLLALLAQAKRHVEGGSPMCSIPSWNPSRLLGYIGVSGTYNLVTLTDYLDKRGLYKSMMFAIMSDATGKPMIEQFSPTLQIINLSSEVMNSLPPFTILHGTADMSVPVDNAIEFAKTVNALGGKCKLHLYRNKTHTQPILEDPMRGGRDVLMDDVLSVIRGEACSNHQFPMAPSLMINAATFVCPF